MRRIRIILTGLGLLLACLFLRLPAGAQETGSTQEQPKLHLFSNTYTESNDINGSNSSTITNQGSWITQGFRLELQRESEDSPGLSLHANARYTGQPSTKAQEVNDFFLKYRGSNYDMLLGDALVEFSPYALNNKVRGAKLLYFLPHNYKLSAVYGNELEGKDNLQFRRDVVGLRLEREMARNTVLGLNWSHTFDLGNSISGTTGLNPLQNHILSLDFKTRLKNGLRLNLEGAYGATKGVYNSLASTLNDVNAVAYKAEARYNRDKFSGALSFYLNPANFLSPSTYTINDRQEARFRFEYMFSDPFSLWGNLLCYNDNTQNNLDRTLRTSKPELGITWKPMPKYKNLSLNVTYTGKGRDNNLQTPTASGTQPLKESWSTMLYELNNRVGKVRLGLSYQYDIEDDLSPNKPDTSKNSLTRYNLGFNVGVPLMLGSKEVSANIRLYQEKEQERFTGKSYLQNYALLTLGGKLWRHTGLNFTLGTDNKNYTDSSVAAANSSTYRRFFPTVSLVHNFNGNEDQALRLEYARVSYDADAADRSHNDNMIRCELSTKI